MCHVQELPPKYLVGWLLITACSFLGLICLSFFGRCLEQPVFSQLRGEPKDWVLVSAGQLTIVTIELDCQMMHQDPERMSKNH